MNHRITNLIVCTIREVSPKEGGHSSHMRTRLFYSNTEAEVKLSNNVERHQNQSRNLKIDLTIEVPDIVV